MSETYAYPDEIRYDILGMVPSDGRVIGSIGCGWASTEAVLIQQGREVHGVDICAEAVEVAKRRLSSARRIDPQDRQPFEADSLDGLILADVIEHIPQAWQALAQYAKAVRPGGWVIISVPNMRSIHVLREWWLGGDWPEKPYGIFDATHLQVMSAKRLSRWCAGADLSIERWFDKYKLGRERPLKALDWLTLKCFHRWFMFQLQVRCRRAGKAPANSRQAGDPAGKTVEMIGR